MRGASRVVAGALVVALLALLLPAVAQEEGGVEPRLSVSPLQTVPGATIRADATTSRGSVLPNGELSPIVKYEWDWNGTGDFAEGGPRARFTYEQDGSYSVTVRVTDASGASGMTSRSIAVGQPKTGFQWHLVTENAGLFWKGAQITLLVSVVAILAGLPLGVIVALARISPVAPLRWVAGAYVEFLRGTPLLVQIFIVVFALPEVGIKLSALTGAIVALTVNTSAYQAEIIRGGIAAIPSGQMEAALAMGLTPMQAMRHVILPQALRLVIPPLTNEFVILIKDSSLVSLIGVLELMGYARVIGNRTFRVFEPFLAVAFIYFVMTYSLSLALRRLERKLAIPGLGMTTPGGTH